MKATQVILLIIAATYFSQIEAQQLEGQSIIKTDYLIYLPPEYSTNSDQEWPLMINLHGRKEDPTIETIKQGFVPWFVSNSKEFPLIVVSPVCRSRVWNKYILNTLLDDIIKEYAVDENRIYLTGHSMGGYGTWDWAFNNPERFAAIAPISGCMDPNDLKRGWRLRHTPIWIFHGDKDDLVNIECNKKGLNELNKYTQKVNFTIYPNTGHNTWEQPFTKDSVYTWMLKQNRDKNLPSPVQLENNIRERYLGQYILQDRKEDTLKIHYDGNQLYIKFKGDDYPIPIHAESKTLFYLEDNPLTGIEFIINDDQVVGFNILEERIWPAKRIK